MLALILKLDDGTSAFINCKNDGILNIYFNGIKKPEFNKISIPFKEYSINDYNAIYLNQLTKELK